MYEFNYIECKLIQILILYCLTWNCNNRYATCWLDSALQAWTIASPSASVFLLI